MMKAKRKIIEIDEETCTGCGDCIPGCAEGALQIIEGKARLISDLFCDGLGACIGTCPVGAMRIVEREAEPYDERKVMEAMEKKGVATIRAHLDHLLAHGALDYYKEGVRYLEERGIQVEGHGSNLKTPGCARGATAQGIEAGGSCPGSAPLKLHGTACSVQSTEKGTRASGLGNWPVQISLVPVNAPYFKGADILIAADCTAFASASFHGELAPGKAVLIGCPKLDDASHYSEKIQRIVAENDIRSVTVAHMTVPCCFGMVTLVRAAHINSGKKIPLHEVVIGLDGSVSWSPPKIDSKDSDARASVP